MANSHDTDPEVGGITWELAKKFEAGGELHSTGGAIFEKFKDDMARETWGQGKPFPFAKPPHGFDKTLVARPGYEWLKEYRDADQGYTDNRMDAQAATRRRARG